uniref:Rubredoxin-like domain-containing protein n=1 Tax=Populus trichocarpa TaxID=3694 RepID=A0A2K1YC15_POPTR
MKATLPLVLRTSLPATKTSPSPCLLSLTGNNVGLRGPTDRFALKSSFFSPSLHLLITSYKHQQQPLAPAAPRFSMRAAAKQAYICRDCGRFREYMPAVAKNDNDTDVRKARKTQIQRDEAIGRALPIAVVVGVVACLKILKVVNWR